MSPKQNILIRMARIGGQEKVSRIGDPNKMDRMGGPEVESKNRRARRGWSK